ncbi:hypothetical protein ACA910_008726 [Epithemia clementina (nom. ined.)]
MIDCHVISALFRKKSNFFLMLSREAAPASNSTPGLSPADIEKIVLATTQLVLTALQQAPASARISGASTNRPSGHKSSTRSHDGDMSFDSEMLPSDGAA